MSKLEENMKSLGITKEMRKDWAYEYFKIGKYNNGS